MALKQQEKLARAREILGYDFLDDELLWEALSAPGALGVRVEGNQGLASIGPHAMQTVLKTQSFHRRESVGVATDHASLSLGNKRLSAVFQENDLEECLNANPGQVQTSPKTAVSVINALVGLVSLQEGGRTEKIEKVMQKLGIIDAVEEDSDAKPVKTE